MRHRLLEAFALLVRIETAYEKYRIEMRRAAGTILENYGILISDAHAGVVEASYSN
jgi:hypothetical protein